VYIHNKQKEKEKEEEEEEEEKEWMRQQLYTDGKSIPKGEIYKI
jgi:hypothetical protein